jgi:hypothetical protein
VLSAGITLLGFAKSSGQGPESSFVMARAANELVQPIRHRLPAILRDPEAAARDHRPRGMPRAEEGAGRVGVDCGVPALTPPLGIPLEPEPNTGGEQLDRDRVGGTRRNSRPVAAGLTAEPPPRVPRVEAQLVTPEE